MPGEYPSAGYENPYKATHALDPRVDGGKAGDAPLPQTTETTSATTETTAPAPSTLATTADPAERSAEYSGSVGSKGLDAADTSTPAADTSAPAAAQTESGQEQQGIAGKVLGSLGIGSAAAAAAGYLGYGKKTEGADEPHDTSAVATQPDQVSQETGPPKHYRRESIPTTAYPAGPTSPRAVAPPIGGTQLPPGQDDGAVSQDAPVQPARTVHDQITTQPEAESHTGRDIAAGSAAAAAVGTGAYAVHEHGKHETPATSAPISDTTAPTQTETTTSTALPDRTKDSPIDAVAAAPGRLNDQDAKPTPSSALAEEPEKKEEDHTARNAALGTGAGAAVVGGAAYAAHDRTDEDAARQAAEREKELAKQREAEQKEAAKAEEKRQKELQKQEKEAEKEQKKAEKEAEKEQKAAEKEAEKERKEAEKQAEKEEKKHQKEVEKEEKKQQKELEKEEKERQASLAAAEERDRARAAAEEEDRKRKEREAAAGVGAAAFTGAGMTAHEKYDEEEAAKEKKEEKKEKEKKPSIFKRIFKRRKNKDTGEDEDYSTDDEEDKAAKSGSVPVHHSEDKGRTVLGAAGTSGASGEPRDSITGLPYDPSKDEEAARRLSRDPAAAESTAARGLEAAPPGTGPVDTSTSKKSPEELPVEKLTGLPYDPSKDEAAAARLAREDYAALDIQKQAEEIQAAGGEQPVTATSGVGHSATTTSGTGQTVATTTSKDEPTTSAVSGDQGVKPSSLSEPFGVIGDTKR